MKKLITIFLIIFLTFSCTTRKVEKENEKIVYVDKIKRDSIFINKEIIKTDTIFNEILVDCDSTSFSQSFGDSKSNIRIVKENGKVLIKYVKTPSETKYEKIYIEKENKKDSISTEKKVENTTKTKSNFFANIYKIAFLVLLVLWILGITPKFIISKFV